MAYLADKTKEDYFFNFPGRITFKEVFLYSKMFSRPFPPIILQMTALVHGILPLALYAYEDFTDEDREGFREIRYTSPYFWAYTGSSMLINIMIFYVNLGFIEIGIVDMSRRLFC